MAMASKWRACTKEWTLPATINEGNAELFAIETTDADAESVVTYSITGGSDAASFTLVQYGDVNPFLIDRYTDHALKGNDAAYRRFDTLEGRADLARRYYAYLVTGVTPAARKQPDLKVVA